MFSGSRGRPNLFSLFEYGEGISKQTQQKPKRTRKSESPKAISKLLTVFPSDGHREQEKHLWHS